MRRTISIRELHLDTGRWVRQAAASGPVVVSDRGRPIATLQPFAPEELGKPLPNREAAILRQPRIPVDSGQYVTELREGR